MAKPHKSAPRAAMPKVRVKLPCADESEFTRKYAPAIAQGGLSVPTKSPLPIGSRVVLKLEMEEGDVRVSGEAVITRHVESDGKISMLLRYLQLDPGSYPIPLHAPALGPRPGGDSAASPFETQEITDVVPSIWNRLVRGLHRAMHALRTRFGASG